MAHIIDAGINLYVASLAGSDGLALGHYWVSDIVELPGVRLADVRAIAQVGPIIGWTSQGDRIREWDGSAADLVALADRRQSAAKINVSAQRAADAAAANAAAAKVALGGSKIFPGIRGYEEGEV